MAGSRFRLILPDGETVDDVLDALGAFKLSGIAAGTCELQFLDLDASSWDHDTSSPDTIDDELEEDEPEEDDEIIDDDLEVDPPDDIDENSPFDHGDLDLKDEE